MPLVSYCSFRQRLKRASYKTLLKCPFYSSFYASFLVASTSAKSHSIKDSWLGGKLCAGEGRKLE